MRLTVLSALLSCGLALSAASPAVAAERPPAPPADERPLPAAAAQRALETATRVLTGSRPQPRTAGAAPSAHGPSASVALRDLLVARPSLRGTDRRRADSLLARPTDGASDPYGDGYLAPSRRVCNRRLCVHFVRRGQDAATWQWARHTLSVMSQVWTHHVDTLGYRRPLRDGRAGGDNRFDVYLKDVGAHGYYGYCAPERQPTRAKLASGFCVLDDDFSYHQFRTAARHSLRVTAAHEFFHAIQYAYDFREHAWLLEATATWVEERFADGIDDNRQYLRHGQLAKPERPLDTEGWAPDLPQYGNWLFFEHLSSRFGVGAVHQVWRRAADFRGAPDMTSVRALQDFVRDRTRNHRQAGFAPYFAGYAGGNTAPEHTYEEGASYGSYPEPADTDADGWRQLSVLGGADRTGWMRIRHLAAVHVAVPRDVALPADRLRVTVRGPSGPNGVAGVLVHHADDAVAPRRRVLRLGADGKAVVTVPFDETVAGVTVTPANASPGGSPRPFHVHARKIESTG